MKSFLVMLAALVSLSAFADLDKGSVATLLKNKDVKSLVKKMSKDGLSLSVIEDVHATAGVVPRCPCQSYKLTFSGYKKSSIIKSVRIEGFQDKVTEIE